MGNRSGYHSARLGQNLLHGAALAGAEVRGQRFAAVQQPLEREDVRLRQVAYMNVVADRRAVRCRVIRAEDLKRGPLPERGFEDERNQVGFRIVRLADLAVRIRDGRIEVTECRPFQAVALSSEEGRVGEEGES